MKYIAIIYLFSVTTILGEPLPIDDIDFPDVTLIPQGYVLEILVKLLFKQMKY